MKPASRLTMDFAARMVEDLATSNTLRGAWAEQLVAHYVGGVTMSKSWSYFDMRDGDGREISVKHSVGPAPKFSVEMKQWAWDSDLRERRPETEGWYRSDTGGVQYWCHVYVFAWLPHDTAAPDLDSVLDCERWVFAVLSREQMYENFTKHGEPAQKTAGLSRLGRELFRPGAELAARVTATPKIDDTELVPPRTMIPWVTPGPKAPVETVEPDVVPEFVSEPGSATS